MVACRCEISLLAFNSTSHLFAFSLVSYRVDHSKRNFTFILYLITRCSRLASREIWDATKRSAAFQDFNTNNQAHLNLNKSFYIIDYGNILRRNIDARALPREWKSETAGLSLGYNRYFPTSSKRKTRWGVF